MVQNIAYSSSVKETILLLRRARKTRKGGVKQMKDKPNVTICGCGSAGAAIAADVALMGCSVNLYEHPDFAANLEPIREQGGIFLTGNTCSGKTGMAKFQKITSDAEEALEESNLIMITVPARAHERFFEVLAPHLKEGQVVLVNTGYWASLRSRNILEKNGMWGKVTVVEEHIMPYLSRKIGPAQAHIYNFKRDLKFSAFPAKENSRVEGLLKTIYPQFTPSKNVLENNFYPGNPSVHAQITIPKAAFFFERAREFRFYAEVSQCASRLSDAFDKERMRIANAFECYVQIGRASCRERV
jgi:opine dehydrogenase